VHCFKLPAFQAKDLQLAMLLVFIVCMFCINNLPRLLLNLYELFHVDAIITCGKMFYPPVWFLCAASFNHLLLVLNCISNFFAYCFFNAAFRRVVVRLAGGKATATASAVANSTCGGGGHNSVAAVQNAPTSQQPTPPLQQAPDHQSQSKNCKYYALPIVQHSCKCTVFLVPYSS
jgi:hypothetical protein